MQYEKTDDMKRFLTLFCKKGLQNEFEYGILSWR